MAALHGASFAGLIMVPNTPRAVTVGQAQTIAAAAGIPAVGVFRNEKLLAVAQAALALDLHAVQLHGEEDAGYIRALRAHLPPEVEIWATAAVGADVPDRRLGADRTLFDTARNGGSGGTGLAFDWSRLAGRDDLAASILAGGLKPANARAAARVGAYALDVSSGVEMAPGRTDAARLSAFFEALRLPVRKEIAPC
jgi:indole-3-glycerol phosphate synthase / phosphoribosylanthranilate isomerase